MYRVQIDRVKNGYIVNVGCWTLVFEDREKMLGELCEYYRTPEQVIEEYVKKFGDVQISPCPPPAPPPDGAIGYAIGARP